MAPNKFATMLNRNTNKISIILIYAVLEWILIALLLLNSLFSYLIIKFSEYFGLKPPCLWCTRLDHIFDPAKRGKNLHRDLLCEAHSKEISKLGYCLNHQKLVESQEMCEDCLSSRPELNGFSKKFDFFSRVRDFGMIQRNEERICENGVVSLNCSCCGVSLDNVDNNNDTYSSYIFLKTPSWDVLECAHKKDFALDDNYIQEKCDLDKKISDFAANLWDGEKVLEDTNECHEINSELDRSLEVAAIEQMKILRIEKYEKKDTTMEMREDEATLMDENSTLITKDKSVQVCVEEYSPIEISSPHLEFFLDDSGQRLVPNELIDSIEEHQGNDSFMIEHHGTIKVQECGFDCGLQVQEEDDFFMETVRRIVEVDSALDVKINEEPKFQGPDSVEIGETEVSEAFHAKNFEEFTYFYVKKIPSELASEFDQELEGAEGVKHSHVTTASEEFCEMVTNENEADVSIGTEIPDLDIADEMQNQASILSYEAEHGSMQVDEQMVELKPLLVQETDHITDNQHSFYSELYEIEEDKVPDTPNSVDSLNHLHKKLLLLEKKGSGAEESVDGSVTNELENGDGVVTMERLKSALRAERKNLQALYAELEEERSASAVAANQTMAMINRLQEEKAAMQMEALQYQRMMDEQTEYDQEALELLNELMLRREKENFELEKELEMCKKKVLDYEAKEKMRIPRSSRDGSARSGFSSGSSNNCEDSDGPDGLSIDLNREAKEEGLFSTQAITTPVDAVANLEECLADFEEERFFILEQLKMLQEKLVAIDETGDLKQDNGNTDLHSNRCLLNGKNQPQRRMFVQTGKSLLPLFDATIDASGDEVPNGDTNRIDSNGMHDTCESKFGTDNNKVAIEEEVDHLYQRLQAFEADKEFLKHCISSLTKGDKGMDLLQEILQHIRDLRNVEFRARNLMEKVVI